MPWRRLEAELLYHLRKQGLAYEIREDGYSDNVIVLHDRVGDVINEINITHLAQDLIRDGRCVMVTPMPRFVSIAQDQLTPKRNRRGNLHRSKGSHP